MFEFIEDEILEFHNQISKNVKEYRIKKGLTQQDLAIALEFKNSSFISHAENPKLNTHHYSLEHLYKISKILDIKLKDLLDDCK